MLEKSKLDPSDPAYRPIYLSNEFNKIERGKSKFLQAFNWYVPGTSQIDQSWKNQVPEYAKPSEKSKIRGKFKQKSQFLAPSTVLFVPNTNGGVLLENLEKIEPMEPTDRLQG